MGRKRRNISEDDVLRWIGKGFGQGEGDAYCPWAKVRDVPSLGRSTRLATLRHKRIHHLYSDVETGHLLQADFSRGVVEIREQVALLPREETIQIAADLGLRPPMYWGTNVPTVMTSDLYVFREKAFGGSFVLCVKRAEAICPEAKGLKRTLEKLQIEKHYWERRGIPWRLVTQCHFDTTQVRNLALLRPAGKVWRSEEGKASALAIAEMAQSASWRVQSLRRLLEGTTWGAQATLEAIGHAVWRQWLPVDLTRPINFDRPLVLREVLHDVA